METVLHEIDEDLSRVDLEEICNVARMSRKRKESVETVLHEFVEDLCRVELEVICYVARRVESAFGDAFGMVAQLLWMRQNSRGHGEVFRNACVTKKSSTR